MKGKKDKGFTLLEIMLVIIIISMLAAIAIPRLSNSSETAREKADITTGREVKAALDRYQIEHGLYPKLGELTATNGKISGSGFIPDYIVKLDSTVTQQSAKDENKGFGIAELGKESQAPNAQHIIMIYLTSDGSAAEVIVYNKSLSQILWSSF